jgi:hypothetical protein
MKEERASRLFSHWPPNMRSDNNLVLEDDVAVEAVDFVEDEPECSVPAHQKVWPKVLRRSGSLRAPVS